ncbi:MAG: CBS domain-containing protein [Rhodospirillaceae bacterium]|jgi:CBS domain-containing protein|nr:CBS domain-containing protein [Rhodospirillaceae bacterium]
MSQITDLDPYEATVADLLGRDMCPAPLTVTEDEPLLQMAQEMLARPEVRTAAVVDSGGLMVGIIISRTLAEHFFVEEFPEVVFGEVLNLRSSLDAVRVGQRFHSAAEMMGDPVAVRPDDSLHDAFVLIHATRATGLPVVDETGRPVAYLDLMTLALLHGEDARTD